MAEFHPLRDLNDETSSAWTTYNKDAEKKAKEAECASMPSLDHLSMKDFENVYEPSDDTYLLLDGLLSESKSGTFDSMPMPMILEIGCGSGVASVYMANQLHKRASDNKSMEPIVFVTDINPIALKTTLATAKANSSDSSHTIKLEAIQCDLVSALLARLENSIDILIFNPPYVPTPDKEVAGNGIEASWAGGVKGRRVIDRAVPQIATILSRPNGVAYMITVDDNEPAQLSRVFAELGLDMKPLVRRRAHNEFLSVQKITWIERNASAQR